MTFVFSWFIISAVIIQEDIMKLKGLSLAEAQEKLEYVNKRIDFNNKLNQFARKARKVNPEFEQLNCYSRDNNMDVLKKGYEILKQFFYENDDFLSESDERHYYDYWTVCAVLSGKGYKGFAENRDLLIDRKDLEKYIAQLEIIENTGDEEEKFTIDEDEFVVERDVENTRLNLRSELIPEEETRTLLKQYGFKWSRYLNAWTRQLTPNAEESLKRLKTSKRRY